MNRRILKSDLAQFGNLELLAKQVVEGFITGLHKSPFHGFSVEFAEHRLYNKGESTKHIDWKLYARTEKLFTKKYEEETNLRCQFVIDCSGSMHFPLDSFPNKLSYSVFAAASLLELLKKQRDAVGLTLFSEDIHVHTPAKSSSAHHRYLYHELEKLLHLNNQEAKKGANPVQTLHDVAELVHKRSLIVIFTDILDYVDGSDSFFQAVQHLKHNKHEVIVFQVHDAAREIEMDFENRPYTFVDLETGEKMKLNPTQIKEQYQSDFQKYLHDFKVKCANYNIDFVPTDIQQDLSFVLSQFLLKRQKLH